MAAQQQKQNYQRILEHTLEEIGKNGAVPTLLLHSCCAPCSSYVLEYLSQYFWKEHTIHPFFMPWQGDMKRTWREENAAFAAMSCVSGKEQLWQNRAVLTILPPHSLSAL